MRRSLESLWLRFRDRGDTEALGQVFDEAAPELLRIAMHVTRDPVAAEDLVQATWLAAIEHAGRFDDERKLMPWLLGILTNQRRHRARRDARAVDPTRMDHGRGAPSRAGAEERELSGVALAAIDALDDLHRVPVLLRVRYGLEPAEIAHLLGRSAPTVRSQIHRGLAQVRERDPRLREEVRTLLPAVPLGLTVMREQVMGGVASLTTPSALAGTGIGTHVLGALSVKKTLAVVSILACLIVMPLFLWKPWSGGAGTPREVAKQEEHAEPTPGPGLQGSAQLATNDDEVTAIAPSMRRPKPPEADPDMGRAERTVRAQVWLPGGQPAAGAQVHAYRSRDGLPPRMPAPLRTRSFVGTQTDGDGWFQLTVPCEGEHLLILASEDGLASVVVAAHEEDQTLAPIALQTLPMIQGRVTVGGHIVPAGVRLEPGDAPHTRRVWFQDEPVVLSRDGILARTGAVATDEEGRFSLRGATRGPHHLVVEAPPVGRFYIADSEWEGPTMGNYEERRTLDDPSRFLEWELAASILAVEFHTDVAEFPLGGGLKVHCAGVSGQAYASGRGHRSFVVPAEREVRVVLVRAFDFQACTFFGQRVGIVSTESAPVGRTRSLQIAPNEQPSARLVLRLSKPCNYIRVNLADPTDPADVEPHFAHARVAQHVWEFEVFPRGKTGILVQPEARAGQRPPLDIREQSFPADLLPGATVVQDIDVVRVGTLHIALTDDRGDPQAARCVVRDGQGRQVPMTWSGTHRSPLPGVPRLTLEGQDDLPPCDQCTAEGGLLPGPYTITVDVDGFESVRRSVEIVAGETSRLAIQLERSD